MPAAPSRTRPKGCDQYYELARRREREHDLHDRAGRVVCSRRLLGLDRGRAHRHRDDSRRDGHRFAHGRRRRLDHIVDQPGERDRSPRAARRPTRRRASTRPATRSATSPRARPSRSLPTAPAAATSARRRSPAPTPSPARRGQDGTASLTVTPAGLDHLALSPGLGVDHGRRLAERTAPRAATTTTTRSATSPALRPSRSRPTAPAPAVGCTATAAGAHTVTGTDAGKTGRPR